MKIRLFAILLAVAATPAAAQTVEDAWEYIASQCPEDRIQIQDGMFIFTNDDDDKMRVDISEIAEAGYDGNSTEIRCQHHQNPFAQPGERKRCFKSDPWITSKWYMQGCKSGGTGLPRALHFLLKQHNPDVTLDLD